MSFFIKQLILNKMRQLSPEEVLEYGKKYGFSISRQQAQDIASYVRRNNINPFDKRERKKMFNDLSQITNPETANKANQLFHELIKSYGLEHLFE
ncbi:DUF2624 domain-containing protein [Ornithinibacillus xuwenensis]|uniref:DUF2624 domain-containing protein n=1 Tax=Ornithinibacillus xuwenensis TaxID=3144668 RepID=A0ABU9XCH6_9BACI